MEELVLVYLFGRHGKGVDKRRGELIDFLNMKYKRTIYNGVPR